MILLKHLGIVTGSLKINMSGLQQGGGPQGAAGALQQGQQHPQLHGPGHGPIHGPGPGIGSLTSNLVDFTTSCLFSYFYICFHGYLRLG